MQSALDYFFSPITTGYTWEKTLIYGIILVLAMALIYKLLKKLSIKPDRRLSIAVSPFVAFGGVLRVLSDLGLVESYLFITPGIYFFVFFIVILLLAVSIALNKKFGVSPYKILFISGLILLSSAVANIRVINIQGGVFVLAFFLPWLFLFAILKKWSLSNRIVALIQIFDATVTFVSINFFGYGEQHVLPTLLISVFGPFSFVILKIIAVTVALILIDKISSDKELNNYIKMCIGILAGGTSSRDFSCLLSLCTPS